MNVTPLVDVVSKFDVECQINVTPLVDVVLVLLIIFMVVTPLIKMRGVPVALPLTKNPQVKKEDSNQLVISINEARQIYLEAIPIRSERFDEQTKELYKREPAKEILIRADRRLPYGVVKKAMQSLRSAGFAQINFISEKSKESH